MECGRSKLNVVMMVLEDGAYVINTLDSSTGHIGSGCFILGPRFCFGTPFLISKYIPFVQKARSVFTFCKEDIEEF